jgi:tryptophan synthase beta chain
MSAFLFNIILEVQMTTKIRFPMNETDIPKYWYNINADFPISPAPVLHPQTLEPVTPDFLSVLFPMELISQEISTER